MSNALGIPMKLAGEMDEEDRSAQPPLVAFLTRCWMNVLCLALLGYAIMGRGFAYTGVPPLFVGEIMLILGFGCLLICGRWWPVLRMPQFVALTALFAWCSLRTLPFIREYGMDALRDAIIYVYGLYAFIIAAVIICQPRLLVMIVEKYRTFCKIFLISVPFLWMGFQKFQDSMPHWPWAPDVSLIFLKAGDLQVHLGGILAFWASEVGGMTAVLWFIPMFLNAAMLGPVNRGGMLAFCASIGTSMIFKPFNRWTWAFIMIAVGGMSFLLVTGISFDIPGSPRPISAEQLLANFGSLFGQKTAVDDGDLQGTKEWRLKFWTLIINDTIGGGPYFWKGKGFGINLVSDYGMNIDAEETVRAPHNGHITMLARAGVPGFVLWLAVHLSWAIGMIDGHIRSRFAGKKVWAGLFMWVLIYWLMVVINCSFDPYIEGPMGGVWLWSIYGVGVAAMWLRRREPDLFEPAEDDVEDLGADALSEMGKI